MTGERTKAILRAGVLPANIVQEVSRWSGDLPEVKPSDDRAEVLEEIRGAVEGPDTLDIRLTDMDALRRFEKDKQRGRLYFADGESTTFVVVDYAKDRIGNYIIPWQDENISGLMLERTTFLKPEGGERVFFRDVREMFFGENKVFLKAVPDTEVR